MPNHTAQILEVRGDKSEIDKLINFVSDTTNKEKVTNFSCNKVIPMPKALNITATSINNVNPTKEDLKLKKQYATNKKKYGAENWYDWCCNNWGTKWDVYEIQEWDCHKDVSSICFQSAWSPITPVIEKLSEKFKSLNFTLKYADEGGGFLGYVVYENGRKVMQVEREWKSKEGIKLRKELGYYWEDEQ